MFRSARIIAAGIAAAVAGGLVSAQPAVAVPGVLTAQRSSVTDSSAEKVVAVPCPTGTRAIGGSAVIGGSTRVKINTEVPDATSYTVLAREPRGGVSESWSVVVTALCAPLTALPGLEYRRSDSAYNSTATHSATAACTPGKKLIGVGGSIDSNGAGQDSLVLTAVRPSPDLISVVASAAEDEIGYAGSWRATAVGVCVNPVPGLRLASGTSALDSTATKETVAVCPSGTRIHSGGFDLGTGRGQVAPTTSFVDYDVAGDPSRHGFDARAGEDRTGFTGNWRIATYAICAS
jgi:hypothetical protein